MNFLNIVTNYTFIVIAIGTTTLGLVSGIAGSFAVMKKQSLLGDGISHAALPGIAAIFLITGSKNTIVLLFGAAVAGVIAAMIIVKIVKSSKVKFDSALALVMSVFFGLGTVLLTYLQKKPDSNSAGLERFIFGQATAMLVSDVVFMLICAAVVLLLTTLFWKEFKLHIFDNNYALSIGFSGAKINIILSFIIVVSIVTALGSVGVILMSAMLIAPSVGARQLSRNWFSMVILSGLIGAFCGFTGALISSVNENLPTGPVITVLVSIVTFMCILFAPKRGILIKFFKRKLQKYKQKTKQKSNQKIKNKSLKKSDFSYKG